MAKSSVAMVIAAFVSTMIVTSANAASDVNRGWVAKAMAHAQRMPHDRGAEDTKQITPEIIPGLSTDDDPSGRISTIQPNRATTTSASAFFQDLGTNGRTCFTCHQPQNGWGISAARVRDLFRDTDGNAPIFRPVDGAVCPTVEVSNEAKRRSAYRLLLEKGLIRISLPIPDRAEFAISDVDDPYDCNTNPETGLTSPTSGIVSVYRRPLPSTNLGFINVLMWDSREPTLESQAQDATTGHAQGTVQLSTAQTAEIVSFEKSIFTAQSFDNRAGKLDIEGASGGPAALLNTLTDFYPGINDPLGGNPRGTPFTSIIFMLYNAWGNIRGGGGESARKSIARGEVVFNTKPIVISDVAGINDALNVPSLEGSCGTCHDSPNVGNHSVKLPVNIGISNAGPFNRSTGTGAVPVLEIEDLPVFTVSCTAGPHAGQAYTVTDLGRAMISGKCADIGKMKGPILRGLAARAPFFHNGSADSLDDVVTFYDQRFNIGFSSKERRDLINFLKTL